jgi:hypothetical protein
VVLVFLFNVTMIWVLTNVFISIFMESYARAQDFYIEGEHAHMREMVEVYSHPFTWISNPLYSVNAEKVQDFVDDINRILSLHHVARRQNCKHAELLGDNELEEERGGRLVIDEIHQVEVTFEAIGAMEMLREHLADLHRQHRATRLDPDSFHRNYSEMLAGAKIGHLPAWLVQRFFQDHVGLLVKRRGLLRLCCGAIRVGIPKKLIETSETDNADLFSTSDGDSSLKLKIAQNNLWALRHRHKQQFCAASALAHTLEGQKRRAIEVMETPREVVGMLDDLCELRRLYSEMTPPPAEMMILADCFEAKGDPACAARCRMLAGELLELAKDWTGAEVQYEAVLAADLGNAVVDARLKEVRVR